MYLFQGCTKSYHSNIKPVEPQKVVEKSNPEEVIVYKAPCLPPEPKPMERPPFSTPLVSLYYYCLFKNYNHIFFWIIYKHTCSIENVI